VICRVGGVSHSGPDCNSIVATPWASVTALVEPDALVNGAGTVKSTGVFTIGKPSVPMIVAVTVTDVLDAGSQPPPVDT